MGERRGFVQNAGVDVTRNIDLIPFFLCKKHPLFLSKTPPLISQDIGVFVR